MESQERESEGRAWNFKFSIFWEYFKFHWFGTIKLPIQNTNILISFKCFSKQIISLENFNFLLKMNHLVEMMYSNARLSISPYPFPPHYSLLLPFILLSLSLSLSFYSFIHSFPFFPPYLHSLHSCCWRYFLRFCKHNEIMIPFFCVLW